MLRSIVTAVLLFGAAAASAQGVSDRIARTGLAATADSLKQPASADDRLALGGVRFLRAIEKTLQTRWRHGMSRTGGFLPVLRLPVPDNPAPEPFRPELVAGIFATLVDDMTAARAPLDQIGDADDASLTLALGDIWFDVNMNGKHDPQESLMPHFTATLGLFVAGDTAPTIRFDTADAAWLSAYTHLIAGLGELVLAFDPTDQIRRVMDTGRAMQGFGADTPYASGYDMMLGAEIDMVAMAYFALRQQPDPVRTRAARDHALAMIRDNRRFWERVEAETDNFAEWIPNARQTSALGVTVPPDTGPRWLAVLSDAEDLLEGRKLIPYWRVRSGAGINLMRVLTEPGPVDLAEWVQGVGLLPYIEDGPRISPENWWLFRDMLRGDAALFAIWLN